MSTNTSSYGPVKITGGIEIHNVAFKRSAEGWWSAVCTCGWGFNGPSKLECELKASIHDM